MTRVLSAPVQTEILAEYARTAQELYSTAQTEVPANRRDYLTRVLVKFIPRWSEFLESRLLALQNRTFQTRDLAVERAYCREHLGYARMYEQASSFRVSQARKTQHLCAHATKAELPRILFQKKLVHLYRDVLGGLDYLDSPSDLFELVALHDLYDSVRAGRVYTHQGQKNFLRALARLLPAPRARSIVFQEETKARTEEIFLAVQEKVTAAKAEYLRFWREGDYQAHSEARVPAVLYLQLFCPLEYNLAWLLREYPVLRSRIRHYNPHVSVADTVAVWTEFTSLYRDNPLLPTPLELPVKDHQKGVLYLRRLLQT